jgi:hypothetical protein
MTRPRNPGLLLKSLWDRKAGLCPMESRNRLLLFRNVRLCFGNRRLPLEARLLSAANPQLFFLFHNGVFENDGRGLRVES